MNDQTARPPETRGLAQWPVFQGKLLDRLEVGQQQYGDASFERPVVEIADEIEQELLDIVGWGYILWCRLRALRSQIAKGVVR